MRFPRLTPLDWLRWLVFLSVAPAWAAAAWIIVDSYQQRRATLVDGTRSTARALMRAVERDLAGAQATLEALAHSPYLAANDFAGFHRQARRVLERQPGNGIVLADAAGQQAMSTVVPWGTPLPKSGIPHIVRRVVDTGEPVAADFYIGATSKRPQVAVAVPVLREGKVAYVLSMGFLPERLGEILRVDTLPPGSIAALLDRNGVLVARTQAAEKFVGRPASETLRASMRQAGEGVFEGVTLEGTPVLTSFSRSPASGWTVAIGIPTAQLTAPLHRALWISVGVAALLLLVGAYVPRLVALRIERAIRGDLETLRDQSMRDALTGLHNRRYLEESLERELARASRAQAPLAVFMLDVDRFKEYNDRFGHEGGDAALRALGRLLRGASRASDLACRFGGEEFTVVLSDTDAAAAAAWAERLLGDVRALDVRGSERALEGITISIGLAVYPRDGTDAEILLQAADRALYAAKRAGRNRLAVAGG